MKTITSSGQLLDEVLRWQINDVRDKRFRDMKPVAIKGKWAKHLDRMSRKLAKAHGVKLWQAKTAIVQTCLLRHPTPGGF
jgi:hypothetical protein